HRCAAGHHPGTRKHISRLRRAGSGRPFQRRIKAPRFSPLERQNAAWGQAACFGLVLGRALAAVGRGSKPLCGTSTGSKPGVLRMAPTQREVTRCGCYRFGTGRRLLSRERRGRCGHERCDRRIVRIRRRQVKSLVPPPAGPNCETRPADDGTFWYPWDRLELSPAETCEP